jgi:hypothetical protein
MQKTERDDINKRDPRWVQWVRRAGFWIMALALTCAMLENASQLSLLLVFGSGVCSLAINAIALALRASPPSNREGARVGPSPAHSGYLTAREFDRINRIDRGQLYTHRLLEAILLNMELKPEPAVADTGYRLVLPQVQLKLPS